MLAREAGIGHQRTGAATRASMRAERVMWVEGGELEAAERALAGVERAGEGRVRGEWGRVVGEEGRAAAEREMEGEERGR